MLGISYLIGLCDYHVLDICSVDCQRRYDIRAPLCAFHVIKIILNVQFYMGVWAWNVKIMT